jgi:uncharacterized protein YejL (UPF0352 family)
MSGASVSVVPLLQGSASVQIIPMEVPAGYQPLPPVTLANASRTRWTLANRKLVAEEQQHKAANERRREAARKHLHKQVDLARTASVGRVATARHNLLQHNRANRQREAVREQFALDEKQRRLEDLREQHRMLYASKFAPATDDWMASEFRHHSPTSPTLLPAPQSEARDGEELQRPSTSSGLASSTTFPDNSNGDEVERAHAGLDYAALGTPTARPEGVTPASWPVTSVATPVTRALVVPSGYRPASAMVISRSAHSRLTWALTNRKKVERERQTKEENARSRAIEKQELCRQVGLQRSASVGRVATARHNLLQHNRANRQREAVREQFALDEKQRRLEDLREQHRIAYAAKFCTPPNY